MQEHDIRTTERLTLGEQVGSCCLWIGVFVDRQMMVVSYKMYRERSRPA